MPFARAVVAGFVALVLTVPLIAVATLLATWTLHTRNAERLQEMLKHRAHSIAAQVMADRQYYGAVVVPRVGDLKGSLGADYRDVHGRFPLPATFVREVSEQLARSGDGQRAETAIRDGEVSYFEHAARPALRILAG